MRIQDVFQRPQITPDTDVILRVPWLYNPWNCPLREHRYLLMLEKGAKIRMLVKWSGDAHSNCGTLIQFATLTRVVPPRKFEKAYRCEWSRNPLENMAQWLQKSVHGPPARIPGRSEHTTDFMEKDAFKQRALDIFLRVGKRSVARPRSWGSDTVYIS
jgi:hypothetical protein